MEVIYRKVESYLRFDELVHFHQKISNVSTLLPIIHQILEEKREKGRKIVKFMKAIHVRYQFTNSKEYEYVLEYISYLHPLSMRIKRDLYAQHYLFHYPHEYAEHWYSDEHCDWKKNILNQYERDLESNFHKFKLYHLQKQMTFDEIGSIGY